MNNETKKLDQDTASARGREITGVTDWLIKTLEANDGECSFDDLLEAAGANGYNVKQIRNAAKQKTTYPRIMQRWTKEAPPKKVWYLETREEEATPEKLDFEEYTAREIERLETVLDGLQELFKSQADPRVSDAILKAQTKLDKYRGFERAPRMLTPEEEAEKDKSLLESVADAFNF
ncbi:hypothetical protein [uncultured Varibaculum sp.]|uniref:hypothetical protein n=1 Tax=uncultured Varibaculum sp. TaxID=413896 RepID=UPI0025998FFB|nr:hypothetical protein [uncultured Varibaculum sp.]